MPDLQQSPVDAPAPRAERRNVTVLFCDVVGSSALAVKLDPEDLREILRAFRECCEDAISEYKGHVARFMGDGMLAYFGFPVAHEDDAERAVNAALQIVSSIAKLTFADVPRIDVRIGIATGLVVVGDLIGEGSSREFALIGEAPNLAASLQQLAKPNQILIAPQTRRLLARSFDLEDLGEHRPKGQEQAVLVSRVLRPSPVRSRFDARQTTGLTPFVGRAADLSALQACFARARNADGQVVTISGEPGIGKSRLVLDFRTGIADDDYATLLFQCSPQHTSSPWYPVIRHIEDAAGISHDTQPASRLEKLEALVADLVPQERATIVPLLAALLSIPVGNRFPALELTPQQQKRRTIAALIRLIRSQAEQRPVLLIGEDVHWVDPSSWELLEQLRGELANCRLLILLSYRPEFRVAWPDQPNLTSISMTRLDAVDARSIVEFVAGNGGLPDDVIGQIVSKTDGVPLFIEEVTKAVLARRETRPDRTEGTSTAVPTVPETLHDSLMARLDRLAPMKAIAQAAAAIGREFEMNLLESVASAPPEDVRTAIEGLLKAGLLFRRGQPSGQAYAFKHALVQDAAYASMLRDDRKHLHRRIATALRDKFSEFAASQPELLAHHFAQAGELKSAISYWLKAGQQASRRSAFVEATTHLQMALRHLPDLPNNAERDQLELQLLQSLASASIAARGFGAAETMQTLNRALQLCEKSSGPSLTFPVLNGMVGVHMMRGEFESALAVAQDLLARAKQQGDTTALLMGNRVLGMSLFVIGRLEEARLHLRKAIELYKPKRHAPLALIFSHDFKATAETYLGLATAIAGSPEDGIRLCVSALAYAEELRHPHSICYVLPFLAGAYLVAGHAEDALPVAERTMALSNEYGFPQWLAGGLLLRGWAHIDRGKIGQGLEDIRSSINGLETTGTLIWMQFAQFQLARALFKAGEARAAEELVERILVEIRTTRGRWYEAEVQRFSGDLFLAGGNKIEAAHCYENAIACAARQGARLFEERAREALVSGAA